MRKFTMLFAVFFISGICAFSQKTKIKGSVVDEKGNPVSLASIIVKETKKGTSADSSGRFVKEFVPVNTLEISAANLEVLQIKPNNQNHIDATLK